MWNECNHSQPARRVCEIENLSHNEPSVVIKVFQNSEGCSTQLTINICPSDKKALRLRPLLYHRLFECLLFSFENESRYCTCRMLIGTSPAGECVKVVTTYFFNIIMTVHHDKLYDKTNEMHFLKFYSDNILYKFRVGKVSICRRQFFCTCSLWYVQ